MFTINFIEVLQLGLGAVGHIWNYERKGCHGNSPGFPHVGILYYQNGCSGSAEGMALARRSERLYPPEGCHAVIEQVAQVVEYCIIHAVVDRDS